MKRFLLTMFLVMVVCSLSFAGADLFNLGTVYRGNSTDVPSTGNVVAYWEDYSHVTYLFRYTWVDSSDNLHSKPLYIGNCNVSDGTISAIQSTTGDANIILHYSGDNRNTWQAITPLDLDQVSGTVKNDTLGYNEKSDDLAFHNARWLVIEAASGTNANQDGNILTVIVKLKKETPTALVPSTGDYVRLGRITSRSTTNP